MHKVRVCETRAPNLGLVADRGGAVMSIYVSQNILVSTFGLRMTRNCYTSIPNKANVAEDQVDYIDRRLHGSTTVGCVCG